MIRVKICGLRDEEMVESAVRIGADRVGFVVVATSPRAVSFEGAHRLAGLAHRLGCEPWIVARLGTDGGASGGEAVDKLLALVENTPGIGAVQLHGGESAEAVADFKAQLEATGSKAALVKAHGVAAREDLAALTEFAAADLFLLDAKPPKGADREGGFGAAFDWSILEGFDPGKDWVLSGGLTAVNVGEAIRVSGARAVDVSSGVERAPGVKDVEKMRAFVEAVRRAG